jgi:hypothetical protein
MVSRPNERYAMTPNPNADALRHFADYMIARGYLINVDGQRARDAAHAVEMVAEVEDGNRVYVYAASPEDPTRPMGRPLAWADAMTAGPNTCNPEETIYDYSDNDLMREWEEAFDAVVFG